MADTTPTSLPLAPAGVDPFAGQDDKIAAAGRLPETAFKASIAVFYGLAVLAVVGRVIARLLTTPNRRLYLDDALLCFGLLTLSGATGLLFVSARTIFISEAAATDPTFVIPPTGFASLLTTLPIVDSLFCLCWTTTFAVKGSFLALFRLLIARTGRAIKRFFWCTVALTTLSWMYFVSEVFILCPYFGLEEQRCLPQTPYTLTVSLSAFGTALDIITDCMIVTLPIWILNRTTLRLGQKISLGIFLCLSLIMICIAIVRAAGFRLDGHEDITWDVYWVYMEGCIACIMASVAAMRSIFGAPGSRPTPVHQRQLDQAHCWRARAAQNLKKIISSNVRTPRRWEELGHEDEHGDAASRRLPDIPGPDMTGLGTYIRRNGRDKDQETVMNTRMAGWEEEGLELRVMKHGEKNRKRRPGQGECSQTSQC